ncbi:MAG: hypothetical protein QOI86_3919 [Actinomycetota bacterium]|nr:hypothetical protein [Actinomycetota bacterium]
MAGKRRQQASPWVGMRRVDWVRIAVSDSALTAEAVGVANRLPTVRPISLATAVSLTEAGVPTVVRTQRSGRGPLSRP